MKIFLRSILSLLFFQRQPGFQNLEGNLNLDTDFDSEGSKSMKYSLNEKESQ